jgi:catechol 2,3-dioxygenase-like lactoylglutathione lyase family enzyme
VINGLHHLAVAVRELEPAAAGYERLLGVAPQMQDGGGATRAWFWLDNIGLEVIAPDGEGPTGDRLRAQLEAAGEGLWLLALASDDLDGDTRLCERRGLTGPGRTERATIFHPETTGGVMVALMGFPRAASQASGCVTGLDHVVIRTANVDRAIANFAGRLGLDLRLDRSNESWGVRQLFFRAGDAVVEFGASLKAPVSDAPDSFGGLAWRVADPEAAQARIAAAGFDVSEVRPGRKPRTRVFTVRDAPGQAPTLMIQQTARMEPA